MSAPADAGDLKETTGPVQMTLEQLLCCHRQDDAKCGPLNDIEADADADAIFLALWTFIPCGIY